MEDSRITVSKNPDKTIEIVQRGWIKCSDKPATKEGKFLFSYYYGIGLGEWGECHIPTNNISEKTYESYILILWPSEILTGDIPFIWDENKMIEMDVYWMPLPEEPHD